MTPRAVTPLTPSELGEDWAWIPLWRELQRTCPECRDPKQSATRNGYSCDKHRPLYLNVLEASRYDAARSSPAPVGLNVERLAEVLNTGRYTRSMTSARGWANDIATRYARLSPPVDRDAPREPA